MSVLSRLSLKSKSFLLISVPVLTEMIFLGSVGYLVWQGKIESENADQLMKQMTDLSAINQLYLEGSTCLLLYGLTHTKVFAERYDGLIDSLQKLFDSVRHGFQSKPERLPDFDRWEKISRQVISFSKSIREQLDEGGLRILSDDISKNKMGDMLTEVNQLLSIFAGWEKEDRKVLSSYIKKTQLDLRRLLLAGVLINLLIAFLTIRAYRKNLVDRLSKVQDNCLRVAAHQNLNPQLDGTDEIARLDRVFHMMAQKLQENERREIAMVEEAIDVICTISASGKFQKANRAAEILWGYSRDELVQLTVFDLLSQEQANELRGISKSAQLASNNALVLDLSIKTKPGTILDMRCSMRWQESTETTYCVFRDVSAEKENERLKDQLVSMVTHDLRTPASSLMAFFSILQQGLYGSLQKDELELIRACVGQCSMLIEIINNFLDLEKIDSGSFVLINGSVDISSLFDAICEKIQDNSDSGIDIKLRDFTGGVNIIGDAPLLESSISGFMNILMERVAGQGQLLLNLSEDLEKNKLRISITGFNGNNIADALVMPFRTLVAQEDLELKKFYDYIRISHLKSICGLHGATIHYDNSKQELRIEFDLPSTKTEGGAA